MELPAKEILIDNNIYLVEMSNEDAMGNNSGEVTGKTKRIRIVEGQRLPDLLDTWWHEVLHAIITCRGRGALRLKFPDEEAVVSVLAGGIVQVLRDNPDWVEWAIKMGNDHCRRSSPVSTSLPRKEGEK